MRTTLLSLLLIMSSGAAANEVQPHEAEALFRAASQSANAGDLQLAETRFRRLAVVAPTARVKLELARILFLNGRNEEALELFRQVYKEPHTPAAVRRNILPYVDELQLRLTRVRYGLNIITDNNPSRVGDAGTIYFNGIPLTFDPPRKKATEYGVEPWASVEKIWPSGYLGRLRGSSRIFQDSELNSARIYTSFAKRLPQAAGVFVQANVDSELRHDESYALLSAETWKTFTPSDTAGFGIGSQIGYLLSENADVSGVYVRPYAFADWSATDYATVFARTSVEILDSNNDYYSYVAPKLEIGLQMYMAGAEITPLVSATATRFREFDPFWGLTREDVTIRASLTVSHDRLSYWGIAPSVTVFHENRDSNIDINSYSQTGGSINFRVLF